MKQYIAFKDGRLGYIDHICSCERCIDRGSKEIFVNEINGEYMDCISGISIDDILYIGLCINNAIGDIVCYTGNLPIMKVNKN
jgi:hypothetical protein